LGGDDKSKQASKQARNSIFEVGFRTNNNQGNFLGQRKGRNAKNPKFVFLKNFNF